MRLLQFIQQPDTLRDRVKGLPESSPIPCPIAQQRRNRFSRPELPTVEPVQMSLAEDQLRQRPSRLRLTHARRPGKDQAALAAQGRNRPQFPPLDRCRNPIQGQFLTANAVAEIPWQLPDSVNVWWRNGGYVTGHTVEPDGPTGSIPRHRCPGCIRRSKHRSSEPDSQAHTARNLLLRSPDGSLPSSCHDCGSRSCSRQRRTGWKRTPACRGPIDVTVRAGRSKWNSRANALEGHH